MAVPARCGTRRDTAEGVPCLAAPDTRPCPADVGGGGPPQNLAWPLLPPGALSCTVTGAPPLNTGAGTATVDGTTVQAKPVDGSSL